ncbi:MAG: BTAD domain-containing putative transcriptional regulator [Hyphomicrobiaceae bacterium]
MSDGIRLQLLGNFSLTGPSSAPCLSGRKLKALLAYLALNSDAPQSRDRLMTLLWGSHFQTQARQNLRQALSRLRRSIGDALVITTDERVSINPELVETDVARLETLYTDSTLESLQEVDLLCSEELLEALSIPEPEWEEWLASERSRLGSLAVEARIILAAQLIGIGRFEEALSVAHRAKALDPFREDVWRQLMQALVGLGRKAEALRCFDELSALLESELATDPDAETIRLRDIIRNGVSGAEGENAQPAISGPVSPPNVEQTNDAPAKSSVPSRPHGTTENWEQETALSIDSPIHDHISSANQPGSPHGTLWWTQQRRATLVVLGAIALCAVSALAWWSHSVETDANAAQFGDKLGVVTEGQHRAALGGARIDIRTLASEPVTIRIQPDGKLDLEWLQNISLRQKLIKDYGTWRSDGDQFCMTFGWFLRGKEHCIGIYHDATAFTATKSNGTSLPWVVRDRAASHSNRLVPIPSEVGATLDDKRLAEILPGGELYLRDHNMPVVMKLLAGGQLDIEIWRWGLIGTQIETDRGTWRIENDRLCLTPGWWKEGRGHCFKVRAGQYAYAFFLEDGRLTQVLLRK